jgi:hypothetical protein
VTCKLPFPADVELSTAANESCGPLGAADADPTSAHALQNAAKNNLCATGDPVEATFATFRRLQKALHDKGLDHFTSNSLPPDRSIFHGLTTTSNGDTLGEGTIVSLVAFVHKAKRGGKESVNCNVTKGTALLDSHIELVPTAGTEDRCQSLTAETIPHFRPVAWDTGHINEPDVPMRFTGPLLVDASHRPCKDGTMIRGNPARFTSVEIHPVYAIDVCKFDSMAKCKWNDTSAWIPLDQWEQATDD